MSSRLLSKLMEAFRNDYDPEGDIIFEGDSLYHHIIIRDEGACRTLYFGPCGEEAQSSINLANPAQAVFEYPGMMLTALPVQPAGRKILMIGLGGGYLPELFRQYLPQYDLTVVEIDLTVAELAQTYFGFSPEGNVKLVIGDGREYIENQPKESLDQIWLDAFSGNYVPPCLSGLAFLKLCSSRLRAGGLLVQNLHQSRPRTFQDQLKTTQEAFGKFLAFDGHSCGNAIIISRKDGGDPGPVWKKSALEEAAKRFGRRLGPYDLVDEMKKMKSFIPQTEAKVIE